MKTPKPYLLVELHDFDKDSSLARVEINSKEGQLLTNVLAAAKSHWGKRRFLKEVAALCPATK